MNFIDLSWKSTSKSGFYTSFMWIICIYIPNIKNVEWDSKGLLFRSHVLSDHFKISKYSYSSSFKVTNRNRFVHFFAFFRTVYFYRVVCGKTNGVGLKSDKILHRPVLFCCFLDGLMFNILRVTTKFLNPKLKKNKNFLLS